MSAADLRKHLESRLGYTPEEALRLKVKEMRELVLADLEG